MIRKRQKRGQRGSKRLDLTDMRAMFMDRRVWAGLGVVIKPEGASSHWSIVPNAGGAPFDILVEVEIQPSQVHVSARLRAGMWEVPSLGDEVALLVPDGQIDFQPVVIARLSSGGVPATQGPQPGKLVIVNGEVLVHDGNGGAVSLALKSDAQANVDKLNALITTFNAHVHPVAGITAGTGAVTSAVTATLETPGSAPVGTSVLKGK